MGATTAPTGAAWQSTLSAVSVGVQGATGDATGTRQITGVAAGANNTDAVNVAQLKAAQTHYFSVNDTGAALPVGDGTNYNNDGASAAFSTAIGSGVTATGSGAVAMGMNSQAGGSGSVVVGEGSSANGVLAVAAGRGAHASGGASVALGVQSVAQAGSSSAIGSNAVVYGAASENSNGVGFAAYVTNSRSSNSFGSNNNVYTTGGSVSSYANAFGSDNVIRDASHAAAFMPSPPFVPRLVWW